MSIYLSASSISDFIKCPQKVLYRFKKPFPEIPSKDMTVGKIIHYAVEKAWNNRDKALEIVRQGVSFNKLGRPELTNLEFMVDLFFLNYRPRLGEQDLIEYTFKFPLYDDVFLVGKMDRISAGNIYDWKTASKISKNLGRDVQCIIYDYAFNKMFQREPASICIASLSTGQLTPYMKSKKHEEELFQNIIPRMIKTIRADSYERLGMFNHSCFRCPYKEGCLGGISNNELDSGEYAD